MYQFLEYWYWQAHLYRKIVKLYIKKEESDLLKYLKISEEFLCTIKHPWCTEIQIPNQDRIHQYINPTDIPYPTVYLNNNQKKKSAAAVEYKNRYINSIRIASILHIEK